MAMQPPRLNILIADDHEVIRRSLRSLLSSRPEWTVCGEATDGAEAVEITRDKRPDVVLMDVSMPEMNGLEATKIIRREFPDIHVLIISQNEPEVTKRQAQEVGAAGYAAKADLSRSLLGAIDTITGVGIVRPTLGRSKRAAGIISVEIPTMAREPDDMDSGETKSVQNAY
jgi:DNA-binding NarL/FixJ family response regulator